MKLSDLYDLANKRKKKTERVKVAKRFAIGMGVVGAGIGMLFTAKLSTRRNDMKREELSTAEKIKNEIDIKAELMKESVDNVQKELTEARKDASKKTENIKEDIKEDIKDVSKTAGNIKDDMKDGLHKAKKVIKKTVKNVKKELDK